MHCLIEIVSTILLFTTFTRIDGQRQGDLCVMAGTIQPGVCRHIMRCPVVLEAAFNGLPYQVCASPENRLIVCCPWAPGEDTRLQARCQTDTTTPREGDNCTMVDTGRAGVCSRFANCQSAIEAASKGQSPQICAVEGTVQIICCPLATVAEGDRCSIAKTGQTGKCLRISRCPVAVEAALKGITLQICTLDGSVPIVCCEGNVEGHHSLIITKPVRDGDNCTFVDTGRAGVCRPFANCQTAKEASCKGIFPQTCDVKGTVQNVCCPLSTAIEGTHCTLKHTGIAGVCRPFANCQAAKEAASKGIFQQKCDLTDNESELVCCVKTNCPPLPKGLVTQLPVGSKAADYCIELAEKIHPCQETSSGWTRGNMCPLITPDSNTVYHQTPMTTAAEAPYYGQIGSGRRGSITWQGNPVSLVSDQWVLCSLYAIEDIGSRNVQFVGLGGTFTPQYNPDEIYGVTAQYTHPLYNKGSPAYNNIALLRLDRRVTFTARILPACLHTGTPLPDSGFMQTGRDYTYVKDVKTTVRSLTQAECSGVFPPGSDGYPKGVNHDLVMCSRPDNTTEICRDWYHGSQLTLPNSHRVACTHLLVGMRSWRDSSRCTINNIRISFYISWIEGFVWP